MTPASPPHIQAGHHRRETVATRWSRHNGFGTLRLLLAWAVMASHTLPLGYGRPNLGAGLTHGQTDVGTLAVLGFFVLSGLLITRSATHLNLGRFLWHRALRILPALWCCLLATAFAIAPLLRLHSGPIPDNWWTAPKGPVDYATTNWPIAGQLAGIHGILTDVPLPGPINGSLWSLRYELLMYLLTGFLAVTTVLRRARWLVALGAAAASALLADTAVRQPWLRASVYGLPSHVWMAPVFGRLTSAWLVPLLLAFLCGALIELYPRRIPVAGGWAACAALLVTATLVGGGFTVVGLPAWAYLVVWCGLRMPRPLARIGARHDYSYGLYLYAFPVQQSLTALHANHWGTAAYLATATAVALALAVCSWHLVERPALRWKDMLLPTPLTTRVVGDRLARLRRTA